MGTRVVHFNTFGKRFPSRALVLIKGPLTESKFCLFLPGEGRQGFTRLALQERSTTRSQELWLKLPWGHSPPLISSTWWSAL
jgi:hypothetical protein